MIQHDVKRPNKLRFEAWRYTDIILLSVHTTKAYCDFPLARTFTPEDPIFPGRLDLARSYDRYVSQHALVREALQM